MSPDRCLLSKCLRRLDNNCTTCLFRRPRRLGPNAIAVYLEPTVIYVKSLFLIRVLSSFDKFRSGVKQNSYVPIDRNISNRRLFGKLPLSRSKCNKIRRDPRRCFAVQAFRGPAVNQRFDIECGNCNSQIFEWEL